MDGIFKSITRICPMLKVNISQKYLYAQTRPVRHRYHDNRCEMYAVHDIHEKIWSI